MIQPTSLWAFLKETDDTELVGRVCRALGGQEVTPPLNCAEKAIYNVITKDNEWMNERIEAKKEQWRKRQEKSRSEKKVKDKKSVTHCHGDNRSVTVTKECHGDNANVTYPPSLPPSLPPSNTLSNESVYITRTPAQESDSEIEPHPTRRDIPTEKTVITAATTVMGVPEAFARWWYREMTARDWTNTDGSPIGNRNWRPTLKAWFNRATQDELAEVKRQQEETKPRVVSYKPEDWLLCAERCAVFADGRCTFGKIVPPQFRPHPIPPEECDKFRPAVANR